MFEAITSRLPENLTEELEGNQMSLQTGFITGKFYFYLLAGPFFMKPSIRSRFPDYYKGFPIIRLS